MGELLEKVNANVFAGADEDAIRKGILSQVVKLSGLDISKLDARNLKEITYLSQKEKVLYFFGAHCKCVH